MAPERGRPEIEPRRLTLPTERHQLKTFRIERRPAQQQIALLRTDLAKMRVRETAPMRRALEHARTQVQGRQMPQTAQMRVQERQMPRTVPTQARAPGHGLPLR